MFFWSPPEQRRFSERTEQMVGLVGDLAAAIRELKEVLGLVKAKKSRRRRPAELVNGHANIQADGPEKGGA